MLSKDNFNDLLKELSNEEIETDRKLEIFKSLQDDKDSSITSYEKLVNDSSKLQDSYNKLKKKSVDDFFNKGTDFTPDPDSKDEKDYKELEERKPLTYDDVIVEEKEG